MGTGEFTAWGNPAMDEHPIQGGVEFTAGGNPAINLRSCPLSPTKPTKKA